MARNSDDDFIDLLHGQSGINTGGLYNQIGLQQHQDDQRRNEEARERERARSQERERARLEEAQRKANNAVASKNRSAKASSGKSDSDSLGAILGFLTFVIVGLFLFGSDFGGIVSFLGAGLAGLIIAKIYKVILWLTLTFTIGYVVVLMVQ